MKAIREVSQQDVPWLRTQWWRRAFDVRARDERLSRLSQEQSTGNTSSGALGQFARFCVVGTSNAIIDFGVQSAGAGGLPHAGDRTIAGLQYGCRRAGRDEQLCVEPAFHVPRTWPVAGRRGRTLRSGGRRHGWSERPGPARALRHLPGTHGKWHGFERTCLSWEPSLVQWPCRFSACVSGCFSASGCHMLLL